jgi:flagellin
MAINTARNLSTHYGSLGVSTRRLSSGLRIGTSADDAAGLAVREMMRANIASHSQGVRNANDAISMIQVADGALQVIDEKLIRMKELAIQAATGTYTADQRAIINDEFQAMKAEINRIVDSTEFNGIKLIAGNKYGSSQSQKSEDDISTNLMLHLNFNEGIEDVSGNGFTSNSVGTNLTPGVEGENSIEFNSTNSGLDTNFGMTGDKFTIQLWFNAQSFGPDISQIFTSNAPAGKRRYEIQLTPTGNVEIWYSNNVFTNHVVTPSPVSLNTWHLLTNTYDNGEYKLYLDGAELITRNVGNGNVAFLANTSFGYDPYQAIHNYERFDGLIDDVRIYNKALSPRAIEEYYGLSGNIENSVDYEKDDVNQIIVHFGPSNDALEDYYAVNIPSATGEWLKIDNLSLTTQETAQNSLDKITEAIIYKDKIRASLGATQNRLENTVTNLQIQAENLQAAESRISDADMATEMTEFVKSQILTQSATAMLAQANALPEMALQLIQGQG